MKFWKLHGIGNDFIAIDGRLEDKDNTYYSNLAKKVCNRRFSVGADGLLVVKDSGIADTYMMYYNSDGSRASMCGNGLRCFCKFVHDNNIINKDIFTVETLDGIKKIVLNKNHNKIETIKVNMGKGSFLCKDININSKNEHFINEKIYILDKEFNVSSMLMGVPHTVIIVEELNKDEVIKYGEEIEKHYLFKNKTNVNFVKVKDRSNIDVNTWERGCGYTFGCGTGMTASAIILNKLGLVSSEVNVTSEGGTVKIDLADGFAYMIGEAVKICEGILEV